MAEPIGELIQFPYSHYNEKVRWALDYKSVPHRRRNLLPGPHAFLVKRLSSQTQVPLLRFGDLVVHGSARIIDELEKRFPDSTLYPADPTLQKRALDLQAWFDEVIGPAVRVMSFSAMIGDPGYICRMLSTGHRAPVRALYRAIYPLASGMLKKGIGLTGEAAVERAYSVTREGLDFVAAEPGPSGYLVGDSFSVADLTAASILAPAADPPDSPMSRPLPRPEALTHCLELWARHPGVSWVLETYRRHRPQSAELRHPEKGTSR